MNTKAKGSRNERKSMRLLESMGYNCTKSGASLGVWDIIGIGYYDFVLVQVKSNQWPSAEEMETMQNFKCPHNTKRLVHRWPDFKRMPDVREL